MHTSPESTARIRPEGVTDAPAYELPDDTAGSPGALTQAEWTWLDTFDWRLERACWRLLEVHEDGHRWRELRRRGDGRVAARGETGGHFADDIEPAALRERLAPIMDMRTLQSFAHDMTATDEAPVQAAVRHLSGCGSTIGDR